MSGTVVLLTWLLDTLPPFCQNTVCSEKSGSQLETAAHFQLSSSFFLKYSLVVSYVKQHA